MAKADFIIQIVPLVCALSFLIDCTVRFRYLETTSYILGSTLIDKLVGLLVNVLFDVLDVVEPEDRTAHNCEQHKRNQFDFQHFIVTKH